MAYCYNLEEEKWENEIEECNHAYTPIKIRKKERNRRFK